MAVAGTQHSMKITLSSPAVVKGTALAPGDYKLSWTADGDKADVTIASKGKVVTEAHGTVVTKEKSAIEDEVVFKKGGDGSLVLSGIRPRGAKDFIVFPES